MSEVARSILVFQEEPYSIKFYPFAEDLSRFEGIYIEEYLDDSELSPESRERAEKLQEELTDLLYTKEGVRRHDPVDRSVVHWHVRNGANLVVCGFYV